MRSLSFAQVFSCESVSSRVLARLYIATLLLFAPGLSAQMTYIKTIDLGPGPHLAIPQRIAINRSTNRMYALNTANNTISVIDTLTNTSIPRSFGEMRLRRQCLTWQ
jgi:hypothetical protein